MNILLIDNFDSFTFNLCDSFERLGARVITIRSSVKAADAFDLAREAKALITLSPGPGRPEQAGCCLELISLAKGRLPLLGICLGHQAILAEAGAQVERALLPVHGKATSIAHDGTGPFRSLTNPLRVGRYHSLGVAQVPSRFAVHAEADGLAMAISDAGALQTSLQFHPESILTRDGDRILANILADAAATLEKSSVILPTLELTDALTPTTIAL